MSQASIVFMLAFGLALVAMAGIVGVVLWSRSEGAQRIVLLGVGIVPLLLGCCGSALGVRVNLTPSMPLGLYRIVMIRPEHVKKGMLVAVCLPQAAAETARRRGYLLKGGCADETEPLLKTVVAIGGDEVFVRPQGVVINGKLLPHSASLRTDRAGRTLAGWPFGRYRLANGLLWIYADHPRSWDSRYWGAVPLGDVVAVMEPLLVVR